MRPGEVLSCPRVLVVVEHLGGWRIAGVEARAEDQLLVCDFAKLTRSWLMAVPADGGGTRLYFGSGVVPRAKDRDGNPQPSAGFRYLQPVHAFYARALLRAAARKLSRRGLGGG